MFTQRYSSNAAYLAALAPSLLKLTLRGLVTLNHHALWAAIRVSLHRTLRWIPSLLSRWRSGLEEPQVMQVVDDIQCKAGCTHCVFSSFRVRGPGLSHEELGLLFDQAADMGVSYVYLIGADPFYRPQASAFLKLLASRRRQIFYLFTEGLRFGDDHLAQIRAAGNIIPVLNIDGLRESTDRRKGEGSFTILEGLLKRLREARIPWFVSTMISTENQDEVTSASFVDWLGAHGAWLLAFVPYTPADPRAEAALVLSREERRALFARAMALNRGRWNPVVLDLIGIEERLTSCPSAHYAITVFHEGTVTPCVALPLGHKESNIRERPLREIYREDPLYRAIRARRKQIHDAGGEAHCMVFTDPSFIAEYLQKNREQMVLLAPSMAELAESGKVAEGRS